MRQNELAVIHAVALGCLGRRSLDHLLDEGRVGLAVLSRLPVEVLVVELIRVPEAKC